MSNDQSIGLNSNISSWLEQVRAHCPSIDSIWLIGSRANGGATEASDWDFIVFADNETLTSLRKAEHLYRENVDFLVVSNGDDFEAAWGKTEKHGSLKEWEWQAVSDTRALYTETKWVENEEQSKMLVRRRIAIRI